MIINCAKLNIEDFDERAYAKNRRYIVVDEASRHENACPLRFSSLLPLLDPKHMHIEKQLRLHLFFTTSILRFHHDIDNQSAPSRFISRRNCRLTVSQYPHAIFIVPILQNPLPSSIDYNFEKRKEKV